MDVVHIATSSVIKLSIVNCQLSIGIVLHYGSCYLPSLEDGLAFLLESLESLVTVLGINYTLVHFSLRLGSSPSDGLESSSNSHRATLTNFLSEANCLGQGRLASKGEDIGAVALVFGDDFDEAISNAEEVSFGSGDAAAGQDEIASAANANEAGETVSAACAGDDAQAGFGKANDGIGGEHAEVRG